MPWHNQIPLPLTPCKVNSYRATSGANLVPKQSLAKLEVIMAGWHATSECLKLSLSKDLAYHLYMSSLWHHVVPYIVSLGTSPQTASP